MILQDDLKNDKHADDKMKLQIGDCKRSMINQKNYILTNIVKKMGWEGVKIINRELSDDKLHTISCIIENLMKVKNLDDVLIWMNEIIVDPNQSKPELYDTGK